MKRRKKRVAEDVARGYVLGIACAIKLLSDRGWGSKKRLPEFADDMIDLFNDWQNGKIGYRSLVKFLEEKTGMKIDD